MTVALVVGGRGYLGKGIAKHLSINCEVIVWDIEEDIFQLKEELITQLEIDFIVNCSSSAIVSEFGVSPNKQDYRINVLGVAHLVLVSKNSNVPLFHFSTREVLEKPERNRALKEDSPLMPRHSYGKSKLTAEFLVHSHPKGVVIRLNTPYTDEITQPSGLISILAMKSRSGKVSLDNGGTSLRDPLHVSDIACFIWSAFQSETWGSTFHLGGGPQNFITLRDICRSFNPLVEIEYLSNNASFDCVMDIEKSINLVGWYPRVLFSEWVNQIDKPSLK